MSAICLVNMPFVSLPRPSLGLGVLKAGLARHGLESNVVYANLRFARRVGLKAYAVANAFPAPALLGEWVFSGTVFPDFHPDHEAFLRTLDPVKGVMVSTNQELAQAARELRRQAPEFVEEVARELLAGGARIVGCTSTFQQNLASLALLRRVRELSPEVVTVMGGANCEGVMGQALLRNFPWLDFVVSGEADDLVAPFFASLLEGEREEVPQGVLRRGGPVSRATVQDLRTVPLPDFDDYFETLEELDLSGVVSPALSIETSRGCWWGQKHQCTFCGLNGRGMRFRSRSPEQALDQFHKLAERHGCRQFMVADNIMDMAYMKTVLPALAGTPYQIFYETKANLKREHLEACSRAGVRWIQPGLESLSDELLQLMDKGTTAMQNLQLLKWARELGVHVTWLMLFAFPGERIEWYEEMVRLVPLLTHLQPPQAVIRVGIHRFSPYFERAEQHGLDPVPEPGYAYVYPLPEKELFGLAYFFVDRRPPPDLDRLLEILTEPLLGWKRRFWEQRPILSLEDDGESLEIIDTRAGGLPRRSQHRGLARQVLLECESIRSWHRLSRSLGDAGLEATVGELERLGLILRRGSQLLGLAVRGDLPTLPTELPLGQVDCQAWEASVEEQAKALHQVAGLG